MPSHWFCIWSWRCTNCCCTCDCLRKWDACWLAPHSCPLSLFVAAQTAGRGSIAIRCSYMSSLPRLPTYYQQLRYLQDLHPQLLACGLVAGHEKLVPTIMLESCLKVGAELCEEQIPGRRPGCRSCRCSAPDNLSMMLPSGSPFEPELVRA